MAEHEINTIINVEARAKGSGTGSLGSVSKQLSSIANLTRVLRASKELKELPTVFADAHKHASAFVGSLGGVNKQLEQTVAHLKSIKGLGVVAFGTPAAPGGGAQAAVTAASAAAASTTTGKGGTAKGGRPKQPTSSAVAAAQQARDKAKVARLEATAMRDLAATEALEYSANRHLQTAGKTNKDGLPPEEAKLRRQRERDQKKGYENWWKKQLKAQDEAIAAQKKADKKLVDEKTRLQRKADKDAAAEKKKVEREATAAKKKADREAQKAKDREAKEAAKVERELQIFDTGFEGRAERRKQEARKKRRGAFRQGFFQGIGGPQFLQRDLTMSQVGGYATGSVIRGGGILGGRAIGAGFAGATGGAQDLMQAIGGLGRGVPVLEGAGAYLGAMLSRAYQASQNALEFRRASNSLFLAERLNFAKNANPPSFGPGSEPYVQNAPSLFGNEIASAYTTQIREFGARPVPQFGDAEMVRRQFEERRATEAKQFATRMGMGVTEYLQQQRGFSRLAGYQGAVETEGLFPTALGVSRVTGLNEDLVGRLSQKLLDDSALSGPTAAVMRGMSAGARLDRMAMSPFVQAIRDGMNESDAVEVLEDIAQQTIRGANLKLGSNAMMATMGLGSALAGTGALSAKTAYDITRGIGRKGQNLAFGAKSSSDLLFLKFFGDLDLGRPMTPGAYNKALEMAGSQANLGDPKRFERMLRFFMGRMGGDPETAAAAVSGEVNRMLGSEVLDVPGARRLLTGISQGKALTTKDLSAAGAVLPALGMVEGSTSFAEVKKAETANREVLAGRKLLDTMVKLDEATARSVETIAKFDREFDQLADLITIFSSGLSELIDKFRDPKASAAEIIKSLLF